MAENKKKIGDKKAYRQIRKGYHNRLEFAKRNYLNMKIEKFKGNGKKIFRLMNRDGQREMDYQMLGIQSRI